MPAEHTTPTEHRPEFSATLRAAIDARRVTLAWLRERLAASGNPVAAATLSYWRSGARRPEGAQSLAAVEELETLLGLEVGTLLSQIGPNQRVGPIGTPQYPLEQARLEQATTETFIALGAPAMDPGRDVSTTAVTEVAADGSVISRTTRTLLQCTSGTITNVPYLDLTPGVRTPAPIFSVVSGGHISRRHSHPSGEVHGAMFELERPLGPAQTTMLEWKLEFPPGYPSTHETGHGVARRARELVLWTRFHPDALPAWIEEVEETPSATTVTPLDLDGATSIHQVRQNWGPGMLVLRWGYDERD
ncbi:hypothetical protein [Microbacterium aerolatum]|uniref:Uncharacterized protein n=1 Tax=Microbacterium aerolatum TaxID=153731 RepID=A0A511ADZ8_9MICO|nr:hypothetical protein [Microbacterium aerolatum]GEK85603.1 hypothetical protein MAE01_07790 [Microbacterium aerolatum]GGB21816.1 hypothetical protein GCM10007198_10380 [Microbacterium aerolatum]